MANPLLSFNAKSVDSEILEKTLVGRKDIVDKVEKELVKKIENGQSYQNLIIAPRGSGKTHITKVLYNRLKSNKKIAEKIAIAYMIEDEVGIANFLDFLVRVLESFIRYKEPGFENLKDAIYEISNMQERQEFALKNLLLDFLGEKLLIVLIENLNVVFEGMGQTGQARLRDFIHENNNICLVATSQNLFAHIQDSNYPFYNFFKTVHLNKLGFDESFEFMKAIAIAEENKVVLKEFEKQNVKGKIRAIFELTGGNHRLLVEFYSFLKAELKSELSQVFVKTMNSLKPYYEQFVAKLPVQQQKIIKFISLQHTPQMGKEIARSCFMHANVASKQLSELYKSGYIDKYKEGKDTYYELREPLMRICFEISESPDGIAKLFIDFLGIIYGSEEIRSKYLKYKYAARLQPEDLREKYLQEAKMFSKVIEPELLEELRNLSDFEECNSVQEVEKSIEYYNNRQFEREFGISKEELIDLLKQS
ncbi:MAG: hypothetical protein JW833_00470, partial [Prolixibacteraceae bacterium]|nr:hypothetical protein [Prolixibacteraceae bacterium]